MTETNPAYSGRVKYTEDRSRKYQKRKPTKHTAEMRLLEKAFALIPKDHKVLDAPCGGGRVTLHLAQLGYPVSSADLSDAMIKITRENVEKAGLPVTVEKQDVEKFTYPDRRFDTVVSFRLFHHFPNTDIRRRVAKELCRIADKYVVLSYFSPASFTSMRNKVVAKLTGKESKKYSTPLREVEGYFKEGGFRLVQDFAQTPLLHTLHVAVFARGGKPHEAGT
jgi:2-polyprenyl-3-methyl-5-hydroxy-6-metoxy-1,4-benzoquinol methylase